FVRGLFGCQCDPVDRVRRLVQEGPERWFALRGVDLTRGRRNADGGGVGVDRHGPLPGGLIGLAGHSPSPGVLVPSALVPGVLVPGVGGRWPLSGWAGFGCSCACPGLGWAAAPVRRGVRSTS